MDQYLVLQCLAGMILLVKERVKIGFHPKVRPRDTLWLNAFNVVLGKDRHLHHIKMF